MRKVFLILFILIPVCHLCLAQITHNPYYWNQPLSYNPSAAGALVDESVQMSITSSRGEDRYQHEILGSYGLSKLLFLDDQIEPSLDETKNLYYLSYQKTITLDNNKKLTTGVQIQKSENAIADPRNLSTIGLTGNYHIPILQNEVKEKYWSFGLQTNLLIRRPNDRIIDLLYSNLLRVGYSVDLINLRSQFKNTSTQNTFGINYNSHKFNKYHFNFGVNFVNLQYKIIDENNWEYDFNNIPFHSVRSNTLRFVASEQIVLFNKIILEVKAGLRLGKKTEIEYETYDPRAFTFGVGFGLWNNKNAVLRFAILHEEDSNLSSFLTYSLSLNNKQYSYNLSITNISLNRNANIFQFGINYKFKEEPLNLLRINN